MTAAVLAQANAAPLAAHLLVVGVVAVVAAAGWLLYRVARRRADDRPSTTSPITGRTGTTDPATKGDDRAQPH